MYVMLRGKVNAHDNWKWKESSSLFKGERISENVKAQNKTTRVWISALLPPPLR